MHKHSWILFVSFNHINNCELIIYNLEPFPAVNAKKVFWVMASTDATKLALKHVTMVDAQTFQILNVFVTLAGLESIAQ